MNEDLLKQMLGIDDTEMKALQQDAVKEWRFKFAGMAMQSLLSNATFKDDSPVDIAKASVGMADLLMIELTKKADGNG